MANFIKLFYEKKLCYEVISMRLSVICTSAKQGENNTMRLYVILTSINVQAPSYINAPNTANYIKMRLTVGRLTVGRLDPTPP